jgi:HEAT repeat protein
VWLNEGFATYYSALFAGHKNGRDEMLYAMYQDLQTVITMKDERPIFFRHFKEPVEQFSLNRAYSKASWVVHMLRAQLGEELFRRCIKTFRKIHTDESLDALIDGINQPDARVRVYVVKDIGKFIQPKAMNALLKLLQSEKNSAVISNAINAIGLYNKPETKEVLLKFLESDSYKSRLAGAAVNAMRTQADISYVKPIQDTLIKKQSEFSVSTINSALDVVAYLSRTEKNKESARNFITGFLNDKKVSVQVGAIRALGTLEDPAAIPILETFANAAKVSPQQTSAQYAIDNIRSFNRPFDNLQDMREQLTNLQKARREMKKEMEEAKKRTKAKSDESSNKTSNATGTSSHSAQQNPVFQPPSHSGISARQKR